MTAPHQSSGAWNRKYHKALADKMMMTAMTELANLPATNPAQAPIAAASAVRPPRRQAHVSPRWRCGAARCQHRDDGQRCERPPHTAPRPASWQREGALRACQDAVLRTGLAMLVVMLPPGVTAWPGHACAPPGCGCTCRHVRARCHQLRQPRRLRIFRDADISAGSVLYREAGLPMTGIPAARAATRGMSPY